MQNANDGNAATYWESANNAFLQSLTVDLGVTATLSRVVLRLPAGWKRSDRKSPSNLI